MQPTAGVSMTTVLQFIQLCEVRMYACKFILQAKELRQAGLNTCGASCTSHESSTISHESTTASIESSIASDVTEQGLLSLCGRGEKRESVRGRESEREEGEVEGTEETYFVTRFFSLCACTYM